MRGAGSGQAGRQEADPSVPLVPTLRASRGPCAWDTGVMEPGTLPDSGR